MGAPTGSSIVRYPVVFQDADQAPTAGQLAVVDGRVLLSGRRRGKLVELELPSAELSEVRIGRTARERLDGYATVVLVRRNEAPVLVAPLGSVLLHEIADLLAAFSAEPMEVADEIDLIVPLRPDTQQRVRELIAQGPPFDPAALKLRRHQVLLGPEDVIFAFEGPQIRQTLERTLTPAQPLEGRRRLAQVHRRPAPHQHPSRPHVNKTRTSLQLATTNRHFGDCAAVIARPTDPPRGTA